tara:strand:- start:829 stop:1224 length:396 start_codon:yes stop_codon:yes gene_type:complete
LGNLIGFGCYDQLPAAVVGDPVFTAEFDHPVATIYRQFGLQRSGDVVQTGMDDAAIAPSLVGGNLVLLLEDDDRDARQPCLEGVSRREAEDAAPHDDDVSMVGSHVGDASGVGKMEYLCAGAVLPKKSFES